MKSFFVSAAVVLFGGLALFTNQAWALTSEERSYLEHASKRAPLATPTEDQILRFESDVTGDGRPEIFYTLLSFQDGGQGYVWSVYSRSDDGHLIPMGDVTFPQETFKPSTWEKDESVHGFYAYGRGGAGAGLLLFYQVGVGGVTEREQTKIHPTGADKETYDRLFGSAAAQSPGQKIEPVRIAIPEGYSAEAGNGDQERRLRSPAQDRASRNSSAQTPSTGSQDQSAASSSSGIGKGVTISAVTLLLVAFGWLMFSKSRGSRSDRT